VVTCSVCSAEIDLLRASTAAGRPRFVPEPDRAGQVVGRYRLEQRLGAGGMGTVYRAVDDGGQAVAVKFLSPALAGDPGVVARFDREVRLLAGLDHPSIVRVIDHGSHDGAPWFAMELVAGEDLRKRFGTGLLAPPEVEAIFQPLLAALEHAHGRGIVHRDLKPANVLLAAGAVKLADFGIAHLDGGDGTRTSLTATAAVLGTLPYMAPEQRSGGVVDRRSDLFSMGVMLYEAITGSLPQGAFPQPSTINRGFPGRVDAVVARLLRPDPAARFATAAEAAAALKHALAPSLRARVVAVSAVAATAFAAYLLTLGATGTATQQAQKQLIPEPAPAATQARQGFPARLDAPPRPAPPKAPEPPPEQAQQALGRNAVPSLGKSAVPVAPKQPSKSMESPQATSEKSGRSPKVRPAASGKKAGGKARLLEVQTGKGNLDPFEGVGKPKP
jgi:serine/threonine-protein kinase